MHMQRTGGTADGAARWAARRWRAATRVVAAAGVAAAGVALAGSGLAGLALTGLAWTGGLLPAAMAADPAVAIARVGDRDIPLADVQAYVQALPAETRQQLADDPQALGRLVRAYVARRLLLDDARQAGWEKRPEAQAAIARARDEALVAAYLRARTEPPAGYPGDAEVEAAYEANKSRLMLPRQYELAQILVRLPEGADKASEDKARQRLDAVRARLRQKDADFAAIAREASEDPASAARGGALGWLGEPSLAPPVKAAVGGLEPGGVSEPVRLADGWHIVKLLATKPAGVPPLAEVRPALVTALRSQRQSEAEQAYLARLIEKTPPAVNELALPQVLQPPAGSGQPADTQARRN